MKYMNVVVTPTPEKERGFCYTTNFEEGDEIILTHIKRRGSGKEDIIQKRTYIVVKKYPYFVLVKYLARGSGVYIHTCFRYWSISRMRPVVKNRI